MRGRQHLGSVGVQRAVVDVQAEGDGAIEAEVLGARTDLGVGEEEDHGDEGAEDHGAAAAEEGEVAEESWGHVRSGGRRERGFERGDVVGKQAYRQGRGPRHRT